ncbi:MAG: membrane protein insertase YidC [Gammaproteobacteria bacterium]|nr:membrane protein insertase YidC [Gammaproteobacteria bacterium]
MDNQRLFLYGSFFFVLFLIWTNWQEEQAPQQPTTEISQPADSIPGSSSQPGSAGSAEVPDVAAVAADDEAATTEEKVEPTVAPKGRQVHVRTDVLDLVINTQGADIVHAELLDYPVEKGSDEPVELLSNEDGRLYVTQSGLRSSRGAAAPDHRNIYSAEADEFRLADNDDSLQVVFTWTGDDGLAVEKIYRFERGEYEIAMEYRVVNNSGAEWRGDSYLQLKKRQMSQERSLFDPTSFSYVGPAIYDGESYEKLDLEDIANDPLNRTTDGGWIAMLQHYFLAAALPPSETRNVFYAGVIERDTYRAGFVQPAQTVAPDSETRFHQRLYLGPKLQDHLAEVAPKLELSVDYGVLTIIAEPLFSLLDLIHGWIGNWGWAIIIVTILIKLLFYKLSEASGKSMAKMRKLQPKLQALKERYADDREALNKAMMQLYQKEKINPFLGCLPILIQLPVFIALYWVLLESVELRQAPFMLWLNDLSSPDPFYILPVLMGIAMWGQMRLNPQPPDPIQAKIMMLMPLMMVAFAVIMPSGLVLYWVVNTVLTAAQQWQINRVIDKQGLRH